MKNLKMNFMKNMKIKIKIKIQSINDIITNSSSEVICRIDSNDNEIKKSIYELLSGLLPGDDSEMDATVSIWDDKIVVDIPTDQWSSISFYRAGIEAILNEKFGKENYIIEYEED